MTDFRRVEALKAEHDVGGFDCGSDAQTAWLRDHALQAHRSDTAKVYVVCRSKSMSVVGYYALAAGSVSHDAAPPRVKRGIGRYPVPVIVLTRLGVDPREQGKGLGSELVRDALLQSALVAERVGVGALLIHAETHEAAAFYQRLSSAFVESPTDSRALILLMKDLRATLGDAAMGSRR